MSPPCYADLGKQARDIFSKNYHFGLIKLDCKNKSKKGVEININGASNNDTGKVNASLETKYKIVDYGLTLKEKWNTDNTLSTELSVEDKLAEGLKVSLDSIFAPQSGKKSGAIRAAYKNINVHADTDLTFDSAWPVINTAAVLNYQGWLAGSQLAFDVHKKKLTKSNFALGYSQGDFVVHTNVNGGQEFGGSMYQKVNDKLETGIQLLWTSGTNLTRFGMACVYKLDPDTFVRAKINNSSQIGVGFTHRLKPGFQLSLSALIDGKNFNQGGHKVGLGLDLEA